MFTTKTPRLNNFRFIWASKIHRGLYIYYFNLNSSIIICVLRVFVVDVLALVYMYPSRAAFLIIKLTDQFYFSFQLYAKAIVDLIFDPANQPIDVRCPGVIDIKNKSGVFITDHGATDAFTF